MVKGAVHPNGTNFRRVARLDIVARTRKLCETGLLNTRPQWLEWCERVPPMELHNLQVQAKKVRNPYPQMVSYLLKKHPDLRFQDCYVDGNDWSVGNDAYRDDHPVMQFVSRQLELMNKEGLSKKEAFSRTEEWFKERRQNLESEQKMMMAMALDAGLRPMFCSGQAYLEVERARAETEHLNRIRRVLREERTRIVEQDQAEQLKKGEEPEAAKAPSKRALEVQSQLHAEVMRLELVRQAGGKEGEVWCQHLEAKKAEPDVLAEAGAISAPTDSTEEPLQARTSPELDAVKREAEDDFEDSVRKSVVQSPDDMKAALGEDADDLVRKATSTMQAPPVEEMQRPIGEDIVMVTPKSSRPSASRDVLRAKTTKDLGSMIRRKGPGAFSGVLGEDKEDDGDNEEDSRQRQRDRYEDDLPDDDTGRKGRR
eukprot:gnl/TRDRNA2_/TRDRNA2_180137_c0_seq1.p1 gnl/TRDRNA2_/TRDRNA2_180137_c0~~gnl/TRDRNA2_/TRDRNA2_180137_c0_seq1.p1  ORF type:complete len:426 (+),score=108.88 gnl/TRDRNA2_/TRDRNA2_180137_c0_seq1:102-1379(+)